MLAVTNGKVYTVTSGTFDQGTVLIEKGIIRQVGPAGEVKIPPGADIIDARGGPVTPGFIDAHSHLGLAEEGVGWEGSDVNELTDPVTPHLRAIDAINPEERGLRDAVEGGITAAWAAPGSGNVIGGQGVTIRTLGRTVEEMVLRGPWGLKVAFGENPKRVYGERKKSPATRMATAGILREWLVKGLNYLEKLDREPTDSEKPPERDLKLEAIARVLKREMPLRAHAHRADDIMTALRIAREFGVDLVIEHCTEGHKLASELAEAGVPVVIGPSLTSRSKVELKDRTLKTPGILARAGVKVALMTDHPVIPVHFLPLCAGLAVREGMEEEEALRAVTINAAEILGISDWLGSLEPGKEADVVVFDGHPFELRTRVRYTIMRGKVVYERGED